MQITKQGKRVIAVGDVHGQLEPFVKILKHAGLINDHWDWCGGKDKLLQIGDIFDRGPQSVEAWLLLDKLQRQAADSGGQVIRLVGNHELEILQGNFTISGFEGVQSKAIRQRLTKQVLEGHLCGAYAYKNVLFTHAGVTRKLFRIFEQQLEDASAYNLSILINLIFKESIRHEFFKHPIFNISVHRNGPDRFGGIFWEDITDLIRSFPQGSPVWQVIGHTQVDHVIIDPKTQFIPIDVGMHRKLQYVTFEYDKAVPTIHTVEN